jgi:metal-sulfur cluster biosynthetic enzyme
VAAQGLFDYQGPADLLPAIRKALSSVRDPATGGHLLAAGRVRQVHVHGDTVRAVLVLPDCPLIPVVLEDLQAELFDHLHGRWKVKVAEARQLRPVSRRENLPGCPCGASADR